MRSRSSGARTSRVHDAVVLRGDLNVSVTRSGPAITCSSCKQDLPVGHPQGLGDLEQRRLGALLADGDRRGFHADDRCQWRGSFCATRGSSPASGCAPGHDRAGGWSCSSRKAISRARGAPNSAAPRIRPAATDGQADDPQLRDDYKAHKEKSGSQYSLPVYDAFIRLGPLPLALIRRRCSTTRSAPQFIRGVSRLGARPRTRRRRPPPPWRRRSPPARPLACRSAGSLRSRRPVALDRSLRRRPVPETPRRSPGFGAGGGGGRQRPPSPVRMLFSASARPEPLAKPLERARTPGSTR